jgi:hypothetical protein
MEEKFEMKGLFKIFEEWGTEAPVGTDWSFLPEEVIQTLIPNFMTETPPVGNLTVENSEEIEECLRECQALRESGTEFALQSAKEPWKPFVEYLSECGESIDHSTVRKMWENPKHKKAIDLIKETVRRSRPYWIDERISPLEGTETSSYSFPSGHACETRYIALKLADQFPKRKDDLIKIGDRIARSRIQAGLHYPSDIEAGKAIGEAFHKIDY